MPEHEVSRHTREHRIYLSIDDIAAFAGVPAGCLSVQHVDRAPDRDDRAVRICLLEQVDE
jgi:hypothetical protein